MIGSEHRSYPGIYFIIEGLRFEPLIPVRAEAVLTSSKELEAQFLLWDGTPPEQFYNQQVVERLNAGITVIQYGGVMEYWLMEPEADKETLFGLLPFDICYIWAPRDDLLIRFGKWNRLSETGTGRAAVLREAYARYARVRTGWNDWDPSRRTADPSALAKFGQRIRHACMRFAREFYEANKARSAVRFYLHGYDDGEIIWDMMWTWKTIIRSRTPRWTKSSRS